MNKKIIYCFSSIGLALVAILFLLNSNKEDENFEELVKISLRDVGNKLLLSNQDSTSLILPVVKMEDSKYQLAFQKRLAIHPDTLVTIVDQSFQKANLSPEYRIEVKQCLDLEVAYSYQKNENIEKSIVPCNGRFLPQNCYTIEVRFLEKVVHSSSKTIWIIILLGSLISSVVFFPKRRKPIKSNLTTTENSIALGKFQFYPDENKLMYEATEISLSKKEVELLSLFVANPNKIIKREELSKKVWEDHGVFVGRSLDTYISKLRKKLSEDETLKLTNIHGIGYVLEVK